MNTKQEMLIRKELNILAESISSELADKNDEDAVSLSIVYMEEAQKAVSNILDNN